MRTLVRRLVQLVVVIVVVTFFTSLLVRLLPGDPTTLVAPFITEQERVELRDQFGLNDNVFVYYGRWVGDFFTGDMGEYYAGTGVRGEEVYDRAKTALPKSLLLILYTQIVTLLIAIPLGVYTAYRAGRISDRIANTIAFGLVALPAFVLAAIMKLYLGVEWDLLPTIGWREIGDGLGEHLRHAAMPVIVLAIGQIAVYARLLRSDMVATLQEDFILMAKSKGITNRRILWRHALRPSSLTLLTVAGLNVGTLLSGALVVEIIFDVGGIGSLIYDAIARRQYVALQSLVAIVAITYVLINFLVDVLYTLLDPRIRSARIA